MTFGVGVIGAGPGGGALHLPTLARLDQFRVVHIADGGSGRADAVAGPIGAASSRGVETLLADERVDVVAICSPPEQHAAQVLAAVAAGARAVLCEKPIALNAQDAHAVIEACRAAGTALIVGTNHLFDPAWSRAHHHLVANGDRVQSVSVTASLAPNQRYHDLVSEPDPQVAPAQRGAPNWSDPAVAAGVLSQLVIGLAVHDLPIVRDLAPRIGRVVFARPVPPIGYSIGFEAGRVLVRLTAVMGPGGPDSLWRMTIGTSGDRIDIDFPPPFVHAGSATVAVRDSRASWTSFPRQADDGYLAEWRAMLELLDGVRPVEYDELLADALYAIELADAVAGAVLEGAR